MHSDTHSDAHDWEIRDHINGGWNEVAHAPWCFNKVQIMMYICDFCTIKRRLEVLTLLHTTSLYPPSYPPPPRSNPNYVWVGAGSRNTGVAVHARAGAVWSPWIELDLSPESPGNRCFTDSSWSENYCASIVSARCDNNTCMFWVDKKKSYNLKNNKISSVHHEISDSSKNFTHSFLKLGNFFKRKKIVNASFGAQLQ